MIRIVTFDFDKNVYYEDENGKTKKGDLDFLAMKEWKEGDIVLTDDFSRKKIENFLDKNGIPAKVRVSSETVWSPAKFASSRAGGDFSELERTVEEAVSKEITPHFAPMTPEGERFPILSSAFSKTYYGLEKCGKLPAEGSSAFEEDILWLSFYEYKGFPVGRPAFFDVTEKGKKKLDFEKASPLFMALSPYCAFYPVEDLSFSDSSMNSLLPKTEDGIVLLENSFFSEACSAGIVKSGKICGEAACYYMGPFPTDVATYAATAAKFPMTAVLLFSSVLNLFGKKEASVNNLAGFDLVRGSMYKEEFEDAGF